MSRLFEDVSQLLIEAGYIVEIEATTTAQILLAESPEALVASFACEDWVELCPAGLRYSGHAHSPGSWWSRRLSSGTSM